MLRDKVIWASLWSGIREYKRNQRTGFFAAVGAGILLAVWPFVKPIAIVWVPLLERVPFVTYIPPLFLSLISIVIQLYIVLYAVGTFLRVPALVAQVIGGDPVRALRFGFYLAREPRFFFFRFFKKICISIWRRGVRTSSITDALDQLFVVRVPYLGGQYDAWVTKVQRDWSHDACVNSLGEASCSMHDCENGKLQGYLVWVFLADWPIMPMGRPLQFRMEQCRVPAINAQEAATQIASLGQTAKIDSHSRTLNEADLYAAINKIEDSEPALVVAGVITPEYMEQLWIERGTVPPDWRDK